MAHFLNLPESIPSMHLEVEDSKSCSNQQGILRGQYTLITHAQKILINVLRGSDLLLLGMIRQFIGIAQPVSK